MIGVEAWLRYERRRLKSEADLERWRAQVRLSAATRGELSVEWLKDCLKAGRAVYGPSL